MTTKFLDNKIFKFKIILSWHFRRKTAFFGLFSSLHPRPTPSRKCKFYFCCRLAVSDSRSDSRNWLGAKISAQILGAFFSKLGWSPSARIVIRGHEASKGPKGIHLSELSGSGPLTKNQSSKFPGVRTE